MITKVLDADGRVTHDCTEIGCSVSFDGYVLSPSEYERSAREAGTWAEGQTVKEGDPVEGRKDLGAEWKATGDGTVAVPVVASE